MLYFPTPGHAKGNQHGGPSRMTCKIGLIWRLMKTLYWLANVPPNTQRVYDFINLSNMSTWHEQLVWLHVTSNNVNWLKNTVWTTYIPTYWGMSWQSTGMFVLIQRFVNPELWHFSGIFLDIIWSWMKSARVIQDCIFYDSHTSCNNERQHFCVSFYAHIYLCYLKLLQSEWKTYKNGISPELSLYHCLYAII